METTPICRAINWKRMARPQRDGYDTDVLLQLSQYKTAAARRPMTEGDGRIANGTVAVREAPQPGMLGDTLFPASVSHPNLVAASALLASWPDGYVQFTRLISTVYPYTDPLQAGLGEQSLGSSSHSWGDELTAVHATIDNALGLAQALIREMAHQKLRALGVSFQSASRLITNGAEGIFESPICKDRRLPMTAVFHEEYALMHVVALDLQMLRNPATTLEREYILMLLARNLPRMQSGLEVVARHIETDKAGRLFVTAFRTWAQNLLDQGQKELDHSGYGAA